MSTLRQLIPSTALSTLAERLTRLPKLSWPWTAPSGPLEVVEAAQGPSRRAGWGRTTRARGLEWISATRFEVGIGRGSLRSGWTEEKVHTYAWRHPLSEQHGQVRPARGNDAT